MWEISIKVNIGRLNIPSEFFEVVKKVGFEVIHLTISHIEKYRELPLYHRDTFDRMLIIQAKNNNLTLITRDSKISKYHVNLVKA